MLNNIITVSNRKKCISCNKGHGGCVLNISNMITAPKRSLGQSNVFTSVCHSVHMEGGSAQPPLDADPRWMQNPQGWIDPPDAYPPGLGRPPWMQTSWGWADPAGVGQTPRVGQTPPGCTPSRCTPPPRVGQIPPGCRPPGLGRLPWMQIPWGWADPPLS